ncbi:MAG: hypothetical protein A2X23_07970 [Chloroflexi bacterium GWC2_73_18]|nr:MAG: hypothetical protein A2X23_07970 [Chloroflexi bacterium GWC2_73_18]
MIPAAFDYAKASSVDEALDLLAADGSRALAGGHSILPLLKLRLAHADRLVDIGGLAELKGVAAHDGGLRIGALTTYRELLDSALVSQGYPLLAEATDRIADLQVRNRGTVGGGVAHADPASDMAGILLALDAAFVLRSRGGTRTVASRDFFRGAFTTALAPGELLTEIVLPPLPAGAGTAYAVQEQAASGYPIAGVAAVVRRSAGGCDHVAVGVNGVADAAYRAAATEATLRGTAGDAAAIAAAAARVAEGVRVQGDIHAPAEYRAHLVSVMAGRALERAIARSA